MKFESTKYYCDICEEEIDLPYGNTEMCRAVIKIEYGNTTGHCKDSDFTGYFDICDKCMKELGFIVKPSQLETRKNRYNLMERATKFNILKKLVGKLKNK